jgi:hypothetical protein
MVSKALLFVILFIVSATYANKNGINELLKTREKIESLYGSDNINFIKEKLSDILFAEKTDSAFNSHFNSILDTCKTSEKIILKTIKAFDGKYHLLLLDNFLKQESKKILFFGTSVSCHCTLEMCDEFLKILVSNSKNNGLHYLYVDAFYNYKLMREYDALFIPTAVILDKKNNVHSVAGDLDSLKTEMLKIIDKKRN